ncbi:hypothetical protein [Burkholderia cenocepacia]|uniref:hypothetical protein n=1 Tax=Burkholderia cenocepacia TaxID=95486 RepID=UPI001BA7E235|nr:hypothetical protein [Burkholderia cenocepacia]QUN44126.1 hypothetical protein KEH56_33490 [Burkholderia cenocepacia]QUO24420.1 hypothetical protein KEH57_12725 [Burkholderia cenocepacia]
MFDELGEDARGTSRAVPKIVSEMALADQRAQEIRKMLNRNLNVFRQYIEKNPPDGLTILALIRRTMTEASRRSGNLDDVQNVERLQAEALSKRQSTLAKKRHSKPDAKQAAKSSVRELWGLWRTSPEKYKNKSEFAKDMLDKFPDLKSDEVIKRWMRNWESLDNPTG